MKLDMAKIDFLKKRAEEFLDTAEYHFKKRMYHLVAFDLEQALQLYLKYTLALKLRNFPPTHSLKELLRAIGKAYKKEKEIKKIINENIHLIANLEQAYITSRYLPAEFTKREVEELEKFSKELIKWVKKLWLKV
jgi:HEPN domain-containing protein